MGGLPFYAPSNQAKLHSYLSRAPPCGAPSQFGPEDPCHESW